MNNGYIYGICNIILFFKILDCTRVGFDLVNQKMFVGQYILESQNISWKNEFSFRLNSLCYGLPYYAKNLKKYAPKLPWLKFKHGHPWKTI